METSFPSGVVSVLSVSVVVNGVLRFLDKMGADTVVVVVAAGVALVDLPAPLPFCLTSFGGLIETMDSPLNNTIPPSCLLVIFILRVFGTRFFLISKQS